MMNISNVDPTEKAAFSDLKIFRKLAEQRHVTLEAFGSSNTQRRLPGMTWFDYVELGFKQKYGNGCGTFINAGIGGDTTSMMLARFERDVLTFKPDLVIITAGGNDSNPVHNVSREQYRENLLEIHRRISSYGGEVIFQTYYAVHKEQLAPEMAGRMDSNMETVREVAAETGAFLQDNYLRWNRMRDRFPAVYSLLMLDAMHVCADGNAIIGIDMLRNFGIGLPENFARECGIGFLGQALLDALSVE